MAGVFSWLPQRLAGSAAREFAARPPRAVVFSHGQCIFARLSAYSLSPYSQSPYVPFHRLSSSYSPKKTGKQESGVIDKDAESDGKPPPLSDEGRRAKARQYEVQRPWHREAADRPSSERDQNSEGDEHATGKLLTTPNRLLKFILPLPVTVRKDTDDKKSKEERNVDATQGGNVERLSLFLHPQQPISYVQRLIQAELPPLVDETGRERPPQVYFWAEDTGNEDDVSDNGKKEPGSHVASYSGLGHEAQKRKDADKDWVRWGNSTEIGDFIREAARGREFAVRIEGYGAETRVSVPSFADRTYYQRMRLRRLSQQIEQQAAIKRECDTLAHRSARRLAKGGFAALVGWWAVVYYVTFRTEYGWDLVEPVTYLASLTAIMGGYLWFLFMSRDVSYRAAMNVTVSRQQTALYESRGFDVRRWERLVEEANGLRAEIWRVAYEYDADWDEMKDLGGEKIKEVLEKEEKKKEKAKNIEKEEEEDEEKEAQQEEKGKTGKASE